MRLSFILLVAWLVPAFGFASNPDSVGTKVKDGIRYVIHKTSEGQGLYRIGRIYNVSIRELEEANPNLDPDNLDINQVVLVPREKVTPQRPQRAAAPGVRPGSTASKSSAATADKRPVYHKVGQGETLYAISRKYEVDVSQLRAWNDLESNALKIGQQLIVSYEAQASSAPTGNDAQEKSADPSSTQDAPTPESKQPKEQPQRAEVNPDTPSRLPRQPIENRAEEQTIRAEGIGGWIDDGVLGSNKALALHDRAPVGAILQVQNKINGKTVFVKVVGRIPKSRTNRDYEVLISKPAADILEVYDKKFRVIVEYSTQDAYSER